MARMRAAFLLFTAGTTGQAWAFDEDPEPKRIC